MGVENRTFLLSLDNRRRKIGRQWSGGDEQSPTSEENGGRGKCYCDLQGWVHDLYRLCQRMLMGLAQLGNL